jgi:hypothetical protein
VIVWLTCINIVQTWDGQISKLDDGKDPIQTQTNSGLDGEPTEFDEFCDRTSDP